MRVTVLSKRRDVLWQHAADFLKIFLPVAAEIVRKPGNEALKRIHFSGGKMALRNAGRFARDPNRGHAFRASPEFNERGLRIKSRLDGVERKSVGRKLGAKKSVLKNAGAAALHELKRGGSIVAFQKKLDQRVVNIALVGQKIRFQPRELQLRTQTFNPLDGVAEFRFRRIALAVLQRDLAQRVHGFPLLFHGAELVRFRQRCREFLFCFRKLIHAVKRLAAIEQGLHGFTLVICFRSQSAHVIKRLQRFRQSSEIQRQNDAAVLAARPVRRPTSFSCA